MRLKLGLTLLFAAAQPCFAQTLVNAFDDNDNEIGQLDMTTADSSRHFVFRPDSIAVLLDFLTGEVLDVLGSSGVVFQEPNCQGQAYIIAQGSPPTFDWISSVPTNGPPNRLILITQGSGVQNIVIASQFTGSPPGCEEVIDGGTQVRPVSVINGSDYGLVITPSGNWGYTPPLKAKASQVQNAGETIFCNGFESCRAPAE